MNRTKNVIHNFAWGILSKFSTSIFSFASRTVFIYLLGTNYLGINGLYSEILAFLSLAELGFGASMVFLMYKPVAENDIEKISQLLEFYKTSYRLIALVILLLGLCIVPFLDNIVKEVEWISINELRIYFLFFLFNTVVSFSLAVLTQLLLSFFLLLLISYSILMPNSIYYMPWHILNIQIQRSYSMSN